MIYSEHIAQCNQFAQSGPEELAQTVRFVLATIQQSLEQVPDILEDWAALGTESRHAWGMKKAGLGWLEGNSERLYNRVRLANSDRKILREFLEVPGLGMVKAGFACQLYNGSIGCIDSHNIKLYGIPLSALRYTAKLLPDTQKRKQKQYIELCHGLGGSALLWTRWCDYLATLRPERWPDGETVSRFHVETLRGDSV